MDGTKRWKEIWQFGIVIVQLGLLLVVLRQFQIESNAFLRVALLAFGGFVIHHLLPYRFRLPFFCVLSIASIALVLGVVSAAWLVAIGALLIGICHLPISFRTRMTVLLFVVLSLAVLRAEWLTAPWSSAVWPILGSMF